MAEQMTSLASTSTQQAHRVESSANKNKDMPKEVKAGPVSKSEDKEASKVAKQQLANKNERKGKSTDRNVSPPPAKKSRC
jgi:hypothetical protein